MMSFCLRPQFSWAAAPRPPISPVRWRFRSHFFAALLTSTLLALLLLAAGSAAPLAAAVRQLSVTDYSGNWTPSDRYGSAMASGGDWLAVGAPGHISGVFFTQHTGGRVILWKKDTSTGNWLQQQILTAPGPDGMDPANGFGTTLATDGQTLLVGCYPDSPSHRVHIYRLDASGVWQVDGLLTPATPGSAVGFGRAMAVQGALAVIGSPDAQALDGQVEVFRRENDTWSRITTLTHPVPGSAQRLGSSLAFHGTTLFLGAPMHSASGSLVNSGRVSVFEPSGETWTWSRDLVSGTPKAAQRFGTSLNVHENILRATGRTGLTEFDISISYQVHNNMWFTSPSGTLTVAGSVMVLRDDSSGGITMFSKSQVSSSWNMETSVSQFTYSLQTGLTVHIAAGEVLLGGDLMTSASLPTFTTIPSTVTCYRRSGGGSWSRRASIVPLEILRVRYTTFGASTASDQGWTVVGSPQNYPSYELQQGGFVFTYRVQADGSHTFHSLLPLPLGLGVNASRFGSQVAVSGDWIAVGAATLTSNSPYVLLYQYLPAEDAWTLRQVLTPPAGAAAGSTAGFGYALSMSGSSLLIGAPGGRVACLYDRTGDTWSLTSTLLPTGSIVANETYGRAVCLSGSRAIVGSPGTTSGAAYTFSLREGLWTFESRLSPPPDLSSTQPNFGTCVGLTGDHALVGLGFSGNALAVAASYKRREEPAGSTPDIVWEHQQTLFRNSSPVGPEGAIHCAVSGTTAVFNSNLTVSLFALVDGTWVNRTSFFLDKDIPTPGVRSLAITPTQLFAASTVFRVIDLTVPPTLTDVRAAPADTVTSTLLGSTVPGFYTFTLTNEGLNPVSVDLVFEGDTADFQVRPAGTSQITLGQTLRLTLDPLAATSFTVDFIPQSSGQKTLTVRRTADIPGASPQTFTLTATGMTQGEATALTFYTQPNSCFTGQTLSVQMQGTQPWSFRWLKDGKPVAGATASQHIPAEPGIYQAEVTNPRGKVVSRSVRVGSAIFPAMPDLHAIPGEKAVWTTKTLLAGMTVEWREEPVTETSGGLITAPRVRASGSTSTLTLTPDASYISPEPRTYTVRVHLQALEGGVLTQERPLTLRVYPAPRVELPWADDGSHSMNEHWVFSKVTLIWEGPAPSTSIVYICTGLPPGVTVSPSTGRFQGQASKPGYYTLRASAIVGTRKTATLTRTIAVLPAEMPLPGIYEGMIPASTRFPLGGHASLTLQPSGSFSTTVRHGSKTSSYAGALKLIPASIGGAGDLASAAWSLPLSTAGTLRVAYSSPDPAVLRLMTVLQDSGAFGEELTSLRLMRHATLGQQIPPDLLGKHGVGLPQAEGSLGHGFGTLTVTQDGGLTFAITAPDGATLTGACMGSVDSQQKLLTQCYLRDSAGTAIWGTTTFPVGPEDPPSPVLTWKRLPRPGRLYPDGIQSSLQPITSRIDAASVKAAVADKQGYVDLVPIDSIVLNGGIQFLIRWSTALKAQFLETQLAALYKPQFTINSATGLYSGQLTVVEPDPVRPERNLTRTFTYKGLLLPQHRIGPGQMLVPALPDPALSTTSTTSPIRSSQANLSIP